MKSILIIGYGTMGNIKAALWRSLGFDVYVHDSSFADHLPRNVQYPVVKSIRQFMMMHASDSIIDIVTPNGTHIGVLDEVCAAAITSSAVQYTVLVEKPFYSTNDERLRFLKLSYDFSNIHVVVSENYFASVGLRKLYDVIESALSQGKSIAKLEINFSKNRLNDIAQGRFYDEELGPYGIELPHMIACLQYLKFDMKALELEKNVQVQFSDALHDEGVYIEMNDLSTGASIYLVQSLGSKFIEPNGTNDRDNFTTRYISVDFNDRSRLVLEFDPIVGLPRYTSRITTTSQTGTVQSSLYHDDHLKIHLHKVSDNDADYGCYISPASLDHSNASLVALAAKREYEYGSSNQVNKGQ